MWWSLDNPYISISLICIVSFTLLWVGSDFAVRNYRAKLARGDNSPYEASGLASLLASFFLSTGILLPALQMQHGEKSLWAFVGTIIFFMALIRPCELFRQYLALKREPDVRFSYKRS